MLIREERTRDLLLVCNGERDRTRLVLAIAGKDCTVTLASRCLENPGLKVNSMTLAPKVWF